MSNAYKLPKCFLKFSYKTMCPQVWQNTLNEWQGVLKNLPSRMLPYRSGASLSGASLRNTLEGSDSLP